MNKWLVLGCLVALAIATPRQIGTSQFSESRARAHVEMLAGTIGSRPTGTDQNRRAREYIARQLQQEHFDVAFCEGGRG